MWTSFSVRCRSSVLVAILNTFASMFTPHEAQDEYDSIQFPLPVRTEAGFRRFRHWLRPVTLLGVYLDDGSRVNAQRFNENPTHSSNAITPNVH